MARKLRSIDTEKADSLVTATDRISVGDPTTGDGFASTASIRMCFTGAQGVPRTDRQNGDQRQKEFGTAATHVFDVSRS